MSGVYILAWIALVVCSVALVDHVREQGRRLDAKIDALLTHHPDCLCLYCQDGAP